VADDNVVSFIAGADVDWVRHNSNRTGAPRRAKAKRLRSYLDKTRARSS
jgi:hypothetical protein